jgi:hypothetical protein
VLENSAWADGKKCTYVVYVLTDIHLSTTLRGIPSLPFVSNTGSQNTVIVLVWAVYNTYHITQSMIQRYSWVS